MQTSESRNYRKLGLSKNKLLVKCLMTALVVATAVALGIFTFGFGTAAGKILIGVALGAFANIVAKKEGATVKGFVEYAMFGAILGLMLYLTNGI